MFIVFFWKDIMQDSMCTEMNWNCLSQIWQRVLKILMRKILHRKTDSVMWCSSRFIIRAIAASVSFIAFRGSFAKEEMKYHTYKRNTQIFMSVVSNTNFTSSSIRKIEDFIKQIEAWLLINRLELNENENEILIIGAYTNTRNVRTDL